MRAKIAKRLRRDALRKGVTIKREGMVFNKQELRKNNFLRKHNGYSITAVYRGWYIHACCNDVLAAYRSLLRMIDDYKFFETYKMEDED